MNFLEALTSCYLPVTQYLLMLLFIKEESHLRWENQPCPSISHPTSASPGCSSIPQHSSHQWDGTGSAYLVCLSMQGTNPALCVCRNEQPSPAIPPHCTPAGTPHSAHSSGISLPSPLCINQAAGRLRNMTNTLARISPAVKTQEEGGY